MTKVNDDAQQDAACTQILTRVSKTNPNQSSIIVSVDPGATAVHTQYKVPGANFTVFKNTMITWINAEAAP